MPFNSMRIFTVLFVVVAVYFASNDPAVEKARVKEAIRRAPVAYVPPASQCTATGKLALTFNNGVSLSNTPVVLDVLKSANVPATFYVSSEWVGNITLVDALLRRMLAEGHTVGISWFGDDPRNLTETQLKESLIAQSLKIYNAAGVHPRMLRFPYNQHNQAVAAVADSLGFVTSLWNIDPADYMMCDSYVKPAGVTYTGTNITAAYQTQFDLFKTAGGLKGAFIGVSSDLCPVGPAIGSVIQLAKEYNYKLVDINDCLAAGGSYRAASDKPGVLVPGSSSTTSTAGSGTASSSKTSTSSSTATSSSAKPTSSSSAQPINTTISAGASFNIPSATVLLVALVAAVFQALL
ncbi:hypothetical protein H9P43_002537 [Blastocladiella emersonii ATCC 22665]|nr:hypothetical protein H9P43_002537 [Blastocladiella emersonii ATCC 22665]